MPPPLRFARFAAVSTREQLRPGKYSIPNQLETTLAAAGSLGWLETAGPFVIEGQSRENYIDLGEAERELLPLRHMLQSARLREFDVLVAAETDRFRSLLVQVFRRLAGYRVQLYFLNLPIDPVLPDHYNLYQSDHALMLLTMSQMTSTLEISRTRRKWFENMPRRITELGLPATSIPWAYRKPPASLHDRKAVPEPDPLLVPHLIAIKDMLLAGQSTYQIVEYLQKSLVAPPRGRQWYPQTVRDILRNPFYAGTVRFGLSRVVIDPLTDRKKRDRSIPPEQVHTNTGKHTPLWDEKTHRLILAELQRRARNYRGRSNNQFTGLLKCGICGASLWRQGNGPRGEYREIWRCSSNGSARGHVDIPHVILLQKIAAKLSSLPASDNPPSPTNHPLPTVHHQIEALETQLTRLEDAYLAGQWDLPRYTERKQQIDARIASIRLEARQARQEALTRQQKMDALRELQAIPDLHAWLTTGDSAEINARLHFLIRQITVSLEKIDIQLK